MTKLLLIGDIHGKWMSYNNIIQKTTADRSIQIGDFGLGFPYPRFERERDAAFSAGNHKFIRGNHDDPAECKLFTNNYIDDITYEPDTEMFMVGGAYSIDRLYRIEGESWWADEELSMAELQTAVDKYAEVKPRIMITHEVPESIAVDLFPFYKLEFPSRTRQAFQAMLEIHQPELWVFGHWHVSITKTINNTKFVCLDELETLEIDV